MLVSASEVAEVRIWARGGNDKISVTTPLKSYVNGGGGDDEITVKDSSALLIGAGGNDKLSASGPGAVMIGGGGVDKLTGGGKDDASKDILVGGDVGCGISSSALRAALAGWAATGAAFANSAPGAALVAAVTDNTVGDDLNGGAGADWYIANNKPTDKLAIDPKKGDFFSAV
jgi:Ca2+-binding RTX toxin-like protein